jgi:alkanesulfonate monooxygenase SsuD/methylene tetrahydromethanopterin reductase-like flavin-dependent oxidoreductase (luciferase family)
VARFAEAFTIIRRLLRGEQVTFAGTFFELRECLIDPGPTRPGGPPLLLGSTGPRMMRIGLPHVDAWNVWWSQYGNTAAGFSAIRERVEAAAAQAGRGPGEVEATAAVLIGLSGGTGRLMGETYNATVPPVQGSPDDIAGHLDGLARAGATHLQLVVDPITEASIERLGEVLAVLDR